MSEGKLWALGLVLTALLLFGVGLGMWSCGMREYDCREKAFSECSQRGGQECIAAASRVCNVNGNNR